MGFWGSEGPFQAFNSSRSLKTNTSPPGMSHNALHLRVGGIAGHQEHRALGFGPGGNVLDLLHEGAGGVVVNTRPRCSSVS